MNVEELAVELAEFLGHAQHDRETLRKLEDMFQAVGADLVEAIEHMRDALKEAKGVDE